jgi:hypothetical protein
MYPPKGKVPPQFEKYIFKKGQSGNLDGRPKGKSAKRFAEEYILQLSDEEKVEFLNSIPTELVWRMAEGNPKQETETELRIPTPIYVRRDDSIKENIEPSKED